MLKRSLGLPLLTLYGLGTILGAGIYVLTGVVAGHAGLNTPWAFVLAAVTAGFTGVSYAELSARYPKAAGEAYYVEKAFSSMRFSQIVGYGIAFVGIVSAATITKGFLGYLAVFIDINPNLIILLLGTALGALAFYGVLESVAVAGIIAILEAIGLILVIGVGWPEAMSSPDLIHSISIPSDSAAWSGVFAGCFLAFYAFIGFEDIVNMAEEVKDPKRNLPLAIFLSLGFATLLYGLTTVVAVNVVPMSDLSNSSAPLALVFADHPFISPKVISLISLLAVINGALVQIIMSTRVLYGMANMQRAPQFLAQVHSKNKTPHWATLCVTVLLIVLALWLPIESLAKTTSFITLLVFAVINLSLLKLKKEPPLKGSPASYSMAFPVIGLVTTSSLVILNFFF